MSKLKINLYPDKKEILLAKAVPVDLSLLEEFHKFIHAMKSFVSDTDDAVGLAANQVWEYEDIPAPQIFVMARSDIGTIQEFINPVVKFTGKTIKYSEGCLSRPDKFFSVKRSKNCVINYYNMKGEEVTEKFGDIYAQIIGHEVDHLNGKILKKEIKKQRW